MFRLYVVKALELTKGDTYIVTVDHQTKKDKKIIRLGQTQPVKDDKTNNYWIFDEEYEEMYFYPFIDAEDCKIFLNFYKIGVMKSKKLAYSVNFDLNQVRYGEEYELSLVSVLNPDKQQNPRIIIYVDTYFNYLQKKIASKNKKMQPMKINEQDRIFKNINYLYVYLECPFDETSEKKKSELQIYECSTEDGGYSNLIGRTTPKKSENKNSYKEIIIKKQNFKYPLTQNGCTQLYFFNVNEVALSNEYLYVPLIRSINNGGNYTIYYVFYSFNHYPVPDQTKEGYYDFYKLDIKPFTPHLIQFDQVYCPSKDLFTSVNCFTFGPVSNDTSMYEFKSYRIYQDQQQNLQFDDFAKNIRTRILPNMNVFKRLVLNPLKLYTIKQIYDFHHRSFLLKLKINLTWKCKADLDLSLCVLNKNLDCIGHVSFSDPYFFENKSIKHLTPFRDEVPENGGSENCTIKIVKLPHQAKTILICISSYKKTPFNRLTPAPIIRIYDNTNKSDLCELLYYQLSSISNGNGVLFATLQRGHSNAWYLVPLQLYCNESKPYDAHRVFIEKIKSFNYIDDFVQKHQKDIKDENEQK